MEQHGISKLDLKRQNRMQVLKILKQNGPTSRIDIAAMLELTRAAVTIITNEMIEQGIIHELGEYKHLSEKAPRGRKKILIDINHNYKFVLGITVEEKQISVGLSTLFGEVLDKRNAEITEKSSFNNIFDFTRNAIDEMLSDTCLKRENVLGIGMAIFPSMYERANVAVGKGGPDYTRLKRLVNEATSLPVVFDNSVKGMAMANIDFIRERSPARINTAYLQYGNSLHYAVTNLNDPLKSYDNRTDFVDKIIVNTSSSAASCRCGRRGCAKSELSPAAIVRKCFEVYSPDKTPILYRLTGGDPAKLSLAVFKEAYHQGEMAAKRISSETLRLMAVLLNNLYFSTYPQAIVLQDFDIGDDTFPRLVEKVRTIGGDAVADSLTLSLVEDKHRFLAGCALAIREFFYTRGGFDTTISPNG